MRVTSGDRREEAQDGDWRGGSGGAEKPLPDEDV